MVLIVVADLGVLVSLAFVLCVRGYL
jgi:hypothetical protein